MGVHLAGNFIGTLNKTNNYASGRLLDFKITIILYILVL